MENLEFSVKVSVRDLDEWRELIDCMAKHKDALPEEVKQALNKLLDA